MIMPNTHLNKFNINYKLLNKIDYWQLKDGKPAFARYLQSTINETDVMVSVADRESVGVIGFALARTEILPEW